MTATSEPHVATAPIPGKMAIVAMGLGFALTAGDPIILSTNLTAVREGADLSRSQATLLVGLTTLTLAAGILGAGTLGDILGKRRLYVIGLIATIVLGLVAAATPDFAVLAVARGLLGLAFALVLGLSLATVAELFPGEERRRAISTFFTVAFMTTAPMALIGSALMDEVSWRLGFVVAPMYALLALLITLRFVPETPRSPHRLDIVGIAAAGAGLLLVVFGISSLEQGFGLLQGIAIAGGLVALAFFVVWEMRVEHPALDLQLFASRPFSAAVVAGLAFNYVAGSGAVLLGYYATLVRDWSTIVIGLLMLGAAMAQAGAAHAAGALSKPFGQRNVMIVGLVLLALASLSWLLNGPNSSFLFIGMVALVGAMGNAFAQTPQSDIMLSHAPPGLAGSVSAVKSGTGQAAYSLGPVVSTLLVSHFYHSDGEERMQAAGVTSDQVREALESAHGGAAGSSGISSPIDPSLAMEIVSGAKDVFMDAMHTTVLVAGVPVSLVAAALVLLLMRSRRSA